MDEGISRVRSQLGIGSLTSARAWRIRRVDYPGEAYYLVVFGEVKAAIGVAAVDAIRGEVMNSAVLPGKRPHFAIDAKTAVQLSGFPIDAHVELIWKPCRASLSPLYPIWQVSSKDKTLYIDQQGGYMAGIGTSWSWGIGYNVQERLRGHALAQTVHK